MDYKKAALLSVSDKTGLAEFAKSLSEAGYAILSTGGTGKFLNDAGIETVSIESYTGQKEILNGRVKTLHPRIHAGLLADRSNPEHMAQLETDKVLPIEVAVINLYPFSQNLQSDKAADPKKMVELIDIGGPTMIRAASKNFSSIYAVIDPEDYDTVLEKISAGESDDSLEFRKQLAVKVFTAVANYNLEIARYFSDVTMGQEVNRSQFPEINGQVLAKKQSLRYGENPNQQAAFYQDVNSDSSWQQLNGKELSYNNLLDFDAACRIMRTLPQNKPAAAILKHLNPCGAAFDDTLAGAVAKSKLGDPRSHFGGIVVLNQEVDKAAAENIVSDFAEITVAPAYSEEALEVLKSKKNLRVIKVPMEADSTMEIRSVEGGILLQENDKGVSPVSEAKTATKRAASEQELADIEFAWMLCAHVKSNAITFVKDGVLLASGAGQMSRIDAAELAVSKSKTHGHNLAGAVAASDAFFPFPDCIGLMADEGIKAVIVPSGAKRDQESVDLANEKGISLLFSTDRHFRH